MSVAETDDNLQSRDPRSVDPTPASSTSPGVTVTERSVDSESTCDVTDGGQIPGEFIVQPFLAFASIDTGVSYDDLVMPPNSEVAPQAELTVQSAVIATPAEEPDTSAEIENTSAKAPAASCESPPETESAARSVSSPLVELDGFAILNLRDEVKQAICDEGYDKPSTIQQKTIPHVLAGSDLLAQAETGSGKTAAFACPLLSMIDMSLKRPQVLVLAPTRELAIQVTEAIRRYAAHLPGFRALTIYGGQSYDGQLRELRRGVHIVVGTPGRVMDHMKRDTLKLHDLSCLVLDEADEMLRMGFVEDVEWILTKTPQERQILLFSATLPEPIRRIAQQHLKDPKQVTVKGRNITADSIRQRFVVTTPRDKTNMLTRILESETTDGVIVFVKTRNQTVEVAERLSRAGYSAVHLNGDMPQNQRERTVDNFKKGQLNVLVATDVAARGLDVERVSHVINYDFPHDVEAYVHRIGRTGRAGRSGNAILFVGHRERGRLGRIEAATHQKLEPMHKPSIKAINAKRIARFKEQIIETASDGGLEFFTNLVNEIQTEQELPAELIAAALAQLVHGDVPLLMKDDSKPERPKRERAKREGKREREQRRIHEKDHRYDVNRSDETVPSADDAQRDKPPYGQRGFKRPGSRDVEQGMERYRVEIGRAHRVGPKNLVGAIANETGLDSRDIGRIEIFDFYSTVDLPLGLDSNFFRSLKGVRVGGEQLKLTKDGARQTPPSRSTARNPHPDRKSANGSRKFKKHKSMAKGKFSGKGKQQGAIKSKAAGKSPGKAKTVNRRPK